MAFDIDFGDGVDNSVDTTDTSSKGNQSDNDSTSLDGKPDVTDLDKTNNQEQSNVNDQDGSKQNPDSDKDKDNDSTESNSSTGGLSVGTAIEFDGKRYVVNDNGDIVDENNNIFKAAKDVKAWLDSVDVDNTDNSTAVVDDNFLNSIQQIVGVDLQDDKGNAIEFTNDSQGVSSYINSVIELKVREAQDATINKLFADKPYLKEVNDYYIANGGSLEGFGQLPDRSGIELDKDNTQQLEYIIRAAAAEFGNKSLNDNYIKFLKDTNGLYDVAKEQLEALVEKDKYVREQYAQQAKEVQRKEQEAIVAYWNNVNNVINTGSIGNYKIPETIVKDNNGTKLTLSRKDFYEYLSKPVKDNNGNNITAYQRDLNNLSDEDYLNKELIDAWLMFTGGSYKDLVSMAIKEDQVRTLRMKAKNTKTSKTIKITPKSSDKVDINDIIL